MAVKKHNVGTKKGNMKKTKKNNDESKKAAREFAKLIKQATKIYNKTLAQEEKQGKNLYDLGELLSELRDQNRKLKLYSGFEGLCKNEFAFSRQYGYRMIRYYDIQKELHEKNLLDEKKFLTNSMMLALIRAEEPCVVWQKACEMMPKPTEALVSQIVDDTQRGKDDHNQLDKGVDLDISEEIHKVTAENIIEVLQKIRKQKYVPIHDERNLLIETLEDSWEKYEIENDQGLEFDEDEVA